MAMLADSADAVIGVDTHTDTHTACLLDRLGKQVATITVPADPRGCALLLAWAVKQAPGPRLAWAVEGTRSHGLGLVRVLRGNGQPSWRLAARRGPVRGPAASPTPSMRCEQPGMRWLPASWHNHDPMEPAKGCASC